MYTKITTRQQLIELKKGDKIYQYLIDNYPQKEVDLTNEDGVYDYNVIESDKGLGQVKYAFPHNELDDYPLKWTISDLVKGYDDFIEEGTWFIKL